MRRADLGVSGFVLSVAGVLFLLAIVADDSRAAGLAVIMVIAWCLAFGLRRS